MFRFRPAVIRFSTPFLNEHTYDAGLSETRRRTTCRGELADGADGAEREEAAAGGVEGSDVHL